VPAGASTKVSPLRTYGVECPGGEATPVSTSGTCAGAGIASDTASTTAFTCSAGRPVASSESGTSRASIPEIQYAPSGAKSKLAPAGGSTLLTAQVSTGTTA
jgi:hypothetical protein